MTGVLGVEAYKLAGNMGHHCAVLCVMCRGAPCRGKPSLQAVDDLWLIKRHHFSRELPDLFGVGAAQEDTTVAAGRHLEGRIAVVRGHILAQGGHVIGVMQHVRVLGLLGAWCLVGDGIGDLGGCGSCGSHGGGSHKFLTA